MLRMLVEIVEIIDLQCRPNSTNAPWHVGNINDNEPVIVRLLRRKTHRVTATSGSDIGGVNLHCHHSIVRAEQAIALSGILVNVVDVAVCWIVLLQSTSDLRMKFRQTNGLTVSKENMFMNLSAL